MIQNILPKQNIDDLNELLMTEGGLVTPVPFEFLSLFTQHQIAQFCLEHAVYQVPTVELIHFLREQIGSMQTIEIGAGNGCIGRALGVKMVDSYLQTHHNIKQSYDALNQPKVQYGKDVQQIDANRAVKRYSPECVVGCWITGKVPGGMSISDVAGIDEPAMFKAGVKKYIHVGNWLTHRHKPRLLDHHGITCTEYKFDWLISRSMSREHNIIYIFEKQQL